MNIGNYMYFQFGSHLHCNDGIASQTVSPVANMEQSESMYSMTFWWTGMVEVGK